MDCVRLSSAAEHNRMDLVRFGSIGSEIELTQSSVFDLVRLPNSVELNSWIEFHWVWFSLTSERSTDYARGKNFMLAHI